MKLKALCALVAASSLLLSACDKNAAFSDAQKAGIDEEVKTYLLAHPEILIDMSNKLQEKMAQEQVAKAKSAIRSNASTIFNDPNAPTAGDPNGNVVLVEFFDYQCIHCAEMHPITQEIIKNNPKLKVIYKEFPIFGKQSDYAAAAALAANFQGKYIAMRDALFASGNIEGKMTAAKVDAIAKKIGLNLVKLKKDMSSSEVKAELETNRLLAQSLGLQGTPAFIVAPSHLDANNESQIAFIPGGTSLKNLQSAIDTAGSASSAAPVEAPQVAPPADANPVAHNS